MIHSLLKALRWAGAAPVGAIAGVAAWTAVHYVSFLAMSLEYALDTAFAPFGMTRGGWGIQALFITAYSAATGGWAGSYVSLTLAPIDLDDKPAAIEHYIARALALLAGIAVPIVLIVIMAGDESIHPIHYAFTAVYGVAAVAGCYYIGNEP